MKNVKSNNTCHTEGEARSILRHNKEIFRSAQNDNRDSSLHSSRSSAQNDKRLNPRNDNTTKHYKSFALCFVGSLGVACVISVLLGILLYVYDTFWLFHKPYFRDITYHSDMRIQAKGIIDNTEFDRNNDRHHRQ